MLASARKRNGVSARNLSKDYFLLTLSAAVNLNLDFYLFIYFLKLIVPIRYKEGTKKKKIPAIPVCMS